MGSDRKKVEIFSQSSVRVQSHTKGRQSRLLVLGFNYSRHTNQFQIPTSWGNSLLCLFLGDAEQHDATEEVNAVVCMPRTVFISCAAQHQWKPASRASAPLLTEFCTSLLIVQGICGGRRRRERAAKFLTPPCRNRTWAPLNASLLIGLKSCKLARLFV